MTSSMISRLGAAPEEGIKAPVVVATISNTALLGLQTIDSVQLSDGDRVLVVSQTDLTENGIYNASAGDWVRSSDWNGEGDAFPGQLVVDSNRGTIYQASFSGSFNVNQTEVTFNTFQAGTIIRLDTKTISDETYTVLIEDLGISVAFTNDNPITVTIPSGLGAGFNCQFVQAGLGKVTFVADSGVTLNAVANQLSTYTQYSPVGIQAALGEDAYILIGDISD